MLPLSQPHTPISAWPGRRKQALRIVLISVLLFVIYTFWAAIGKNIVMDLYPNAFSDNYVLDSLGDWSECSMAITTVDDRRGHIIPALGRRLREDPSPTIRANAAVCCGLIGLRHNGEEKTKTTLATVAVPALKDALKDPSLLVRIESAHALWRIEKKNNDVLPTLIEGWKSGGRREKYAANEALGEMKSEASEAIDVLSQSLNDPDPMVRTWAADAIKEIKRK
jgi:hypothetical protein